MTGAAASPAASPARRRRGWRRLALPVAGLVLLAALVHRVGARTIVDLAAAMGWRLGGVVALFIVHEAVRACALGLCLASGRLSFLHALAIRVLGEAARVLTHAGPLAAEPLRAWLLGRLGVRPQAAWAGALAELLANWWVSAVFTVVILVPAVAGGTLPSAAEATARLLAGVSLAFVLVAAAAVAGRVYLIGAVLRVLSRTPVAGRWLRLDPMAVRGMEDGLLAVLRDRPRRLVSVLALQVIAQAVLVIEVIWSLSSMGVPLTPATGLRVEAYTKLANTVQLIGAAEGAYAVVFPWLGLPAAVGVTLALVKRGRSLLVALVGLGVIALLPLRQPAAASPDPD